MKPCACHIEGPGNLLETIRMEIVYCPLHESAEEMLETLKRIADEDDNCGGGGVVYLAKEMIAKASQPGKGK